MKSGRRGARAKTQKFPLLDDVLSDHPCGLKVASLFSTKCNCFSNALQDVNVFLVHLLVGLAQLLNELIN